MFSKDTPQYISTVGTSHSSMNFQEALSPSHSDAWEPKRHQSIFFSKGVPIAPSQSDATEEFADSFKTFSEGNYLSASNTSPCYSRNNSIDLTSRIGAATEQMRQNRSRKPSVDLTAPNFNNIAGNISPFTPSIPLFTSFQNEPQLNSNNIDSINAHPQTQTNYSTKFFKDERIWTREKDFLHDSRKSEELDPTRKKDDIFSTFKPISSNLLDSPSSNFLSNETQYVAPRRDDASFNFNGEGSISVKDDLVPENSWDKSSVERKLADPLKENGQGEIRPDIWRPKPGDLLHSVSPPLAEVLQNRRYSYDIPVSNPCINDALQIQAGSMGKINQFYGNDHNVPIKSQIYSSNAHVPLAYSSNIDSNIYTPSKRHSFDSSYVARLSDYNHQNYGYNHLNTSKSKHEEITVFYEPVPPLDMSMEGAHELLGQCNSNISNYLQTPSPEKLDLVNRFGDLTNHGLPQMALPEFPIENYTLVLCCFKNARLEVYYINPMNKQLYGTLKIGDLVLVEADRGRDLGKVVKMNITLYEARLLAYAHLLDKKTVVNDDFLNTKKTILEFPKPVLRFPINEEILGIFRKFYGEIKAKLLCYERKEFSELGLTIVDCEYQWDMKKLTLYYTANRRIDFRDLVKELFKTFKVRIWMAKSGGISD